MHKIVIFDLSEHTGTEGGFKVSSIVKNAANGRLLVDEVQGILPAMTEVFELWQDWQDLYLAWGERSRWGEHRAISVPATNDPIETNIGATFDSCQTASEKLFTAFNQALNTQGLAEIRQTLSEYVPSWRAHEWRKPRTITFILRTNNLTPERSLAIQRLPWHRWDFFTQRYPGAEIAFSTIALKTKVVTGKLKVLVIFGSNIGIQTEPDRRSLDNYLKYHPSIDYQTVTQPTKRELKQQLQKPCHCIFFVGHSQSSPHPDRPPERGKSSTKIWINKTEYFSPLDDDFQPLFKSLVDRGLQLAVFNSCDGLNLARELIDLHINHAIVMKEMVHDRVAQDFIEQFLREFTQGIPLHIALNRARQYLRLNLENDYAPNASDIPTILQNPYESQLVFEPDRLAVAAYKIFLAIVKIFKVTPKKYLFGGLVLATSIAIIWIRIVTVPSMPLFFSDVNISIGDKLLPNIEVSGARNSQLLTDGINYFKDKHYADAAKKFDRYIKSQNEVPPDVHIFLRNAEILRDWSNNKTMPLKIGTSVPLGKNSSVAKEILRGVGQLQEETIATNQPLLIAIANDNNEQKLAQHVAEEFGKETSILAVVGHNASNASVAAQSVYKSHALVAISPTSFSTNLSGDYIYKMVEDMNVFASPMADRIAIDAEGNKSYFVYICGDTDSDDNQIYNQRVADNLRNKFDRSPDDRECKFSFKSELNTKKSEIVQRLIAQKVNALLISPHVNQIQETIGLLEIIRDEPKLKNLKIYSSPTLFSIQTIDLNRQKNKLAGLIVPDPWFRTPKTRSFIAASQKIWGKNRPNTWRTALAYAATKAVYTGLTAIIVDDSSNASADRELNLQIRHKLNDRLRLQPKFEIGGAIPDFKFRDNPQNQQGWIEYVQSSKPKYSLVRLDRNNEFEELK